jgi:hypothetical protein
VELIRVTYNISREGLGRAVLNVSGVALGRMLRCPEPWDTLSCEKRDRYRKLYEWCRSFDPNSELNRAIIESNPGPKCHTLVRRNPARPRHLAYLNTNRIIHDLNRRLEEHEICVGFFADRKLCITKKYMQKLLQSKEDWPNIPDHTKRLFIKMKHWSECSDEKFLALKKMQQIAHSK